jgi:hypothetical protein
VQTECNENLPFTFLGLFIGNRSSLFEGGLEHSEKLHTGIVSFTKGKLYNTADGAYNSGKCYLQNGIS